MRRGLIDRGSHFGSDSLDHVFFRQTEPEAAAVTWITEAVDFKL